MRRFILVVAVVLAGCGSESRLYVEDGVCYRHERTWAIVEFDNQTHPSNSEQCPAVTP